MAARDDIQRVAAALEMPRLGYTKRLDTARNIVLRRSLEASRQLGVFVDRVGDLTVEELCELHAETFGGERSGILALVPRLVRCRIGRADAVAALSALVPLLDRLEAERNPFAYAVRSLCCLLLLRADPSRMQQPGTSGALRHEQR